MLVAAYLEAGSLLQRYTRLIPPSYRRGLCTSLATSHLA